jgi:3-hydroxyisobutyrate dehydrogenase-like beta-hydroxyacid dehydrogenase
MIESVAEAHVLAEKTGLEAESLHKAVATIFPGALGVYSKRMTSGSYCQREVSLAPILEHG